RKEIAALDPVIINIWQAAADRSFSTEPPLVRIAFQQAEKKVLAPVVTLWTEESYRTLLKLRQLDSVSAEQKRNSLVFIPQSSTVYWRMLGGLSIPFLAPSLTGMALLDGLPPAGTPPTIYYGYFKHNFGQRPPGTQATQPEHLKQEARRRGFENV